VPCPLLVSWDCSGKLCTIDPSEWVCFLTSYQKMLGTSRIMTHEAIVTMCSSMPTSILASKDVSKDFVAAQIQMVKFNKSVIKLEVEDLLCSGNAMSILPLIQSILSMNESRWQSVQFVDAFDLSGFLQWQGAKDDMMRQLEHVQEMNNACLESSFDPLDWCQGKLAWKATVKIPADSDPSKVHQILECIEKDQDVYNVTLSTAPYGAASVIMQVLCGWSFRDAQTTRLLREALDDYQDKEPKTKESHHEVGQKQLHSHRSGLENSFSSATTAASDSSRRRTTRRHRKRNKVAGQQQQLPDYDWQLGAYSTDATVIEQEFSQNQ
jgi:hypothetical protein